MSVNNDIQILRLHIEKGLAMLGKLSVFYDAFVAHDLSPGRPTKDAIVIADVLTNYYTCLETVFLRISQYFENSLPPQRWHSELLEKMTLRIDGIRESAVSDEAYPLLVELMKFRHFRRYYFELDYDWDRLDYLCAKFVRVRPLVTRDVAAFVSFLDALRQAP